MNGLLQDLHSKKPWHRDMRGVLYLLIGATLIAGLGYTALSTSSTVQDLVFKQGAKRLLSQPQAQFDGMRVIVCGSASPLGNSMDRAQACIAVLTPEHLFIFDAGARSPTRINQARLPLDRITGVFLTHFHSDHITGLADVNLQSWVRGRPAELKIFGPPGVEQVVNGYNTAFSLDRAYRTAHHGTDMFPPETGAMQPVTFQPGGVIWEDELATITSFHVDHPPIEPSVGYRVDYKGRSVVISGDSNATDSLFNAAKDADLLLHDGLSESLITPMQTMAEELNVARLPKIMEDVKEYHAEVHTLPERSKAAGIKQLALYHLVPVPANFLAADIFSRGLPDDVVITEDLHTFDLPANSDEILIYEP